MTDISSTPVQTLPAASGAAGRHLKRAFDIFGALVGLLFFSPLFLWIAWRIRRDSPGPVFYRGLRAARGGGIFHILKFRTMYERPESYRGAPVTAHDDPRITALGAWLRATKLNELPQLWNVLRGDMSLVGPRPEDPHIAAGWPADARREILSMRPGLTSPASVLYRDEEELLKNASVMQSYLDEIAPSKLRLDQLYVRYHTFWGDLDILFWTLLVLVPAMRRSEPVEERLLLGPIARLMRRHVSRFAVDTLVTFVAMGLTGLLWRALGPLDVGLRLALVLAGGFAVLFSLANVFLGVNRIHWSRASADDALFLLPGVALATAIAMLFNYFYPSTWLAALYGGADPDWFARPLLPPAMILLASALALFGFVVVRYRTRLVTGIATRWVNWRGPAATTKERVLILGGGETGQFAAWMLHNARYADSYQVAGFVDDDLYKQDARIHGVEVLGRRADIPALVEARDIGLIVFAIHNITPKERQNLLQICAQTPAEVFLFPDIPAALDTMTRGAQHAPAGGQEASIAGLLCPLCMTSVTPDEIDRWLAGMEATAGSGDLEGVLFQIRQLRSFIRGDTITRPVAEIRKERVQ